MSRTILTISLLTFTSPTPAEPIYHTLAGDTTLTLARVWEPSLTPADLLRRQDDFYTYLFARAAVICSDYLAPCRR